MLILRHAKRDQQSSLNWRGLDYTEGTEGAMWSFLHRIAMGPAI